MFIAKKIITAKQMKTYRAKNSSVIKDFLTKGGDEILRRKVYQRDLWTGLREDSKSREFGDRGFTKKDLTKFLGKLLTNNEDHLTNRKVKKISDLFDVKRAKLYDAAAEVRAEQRQALEQQKQIEVQKHEQQQIKTQEYQQNENKIRSHINNIISSGHEKARAITSNYGGIQKESSPQKNIVTKFETSNNNFRNTEKSFSHATLPQRVENNSNNFGHVLFLKNRQHDHVGEQSLEIGDAKARLARIQGKADNYIQDDNKDNLVV